MVYLCSEVLSINFGRLLVCLKMTIAKNHLFSAFFLEPNNLHDYLRNFIQEYEELRTKTLSFEGKNIHLVIHSVICDAPARAFVKCVKSFSGYHGCDKCAQEGEWRG